MQCRSETRKKIINLQISIKFAVHAIHISTWQIASLIVSVRDIVSDNKMRRIRRFSSKRNRHEAGIGLFVYQCGFYSDMLNSVTLKIKI